jgi:anti-sigma factor RsiW
MSCSGTTVSLGAYALGALDARERGAVDAHVATCPECLRELESLIAVASHLARVPGDELRDGPLAQPPVGGGLDGPPAPPFAPDIAGDEPPPSARRGRGDAQRSAVRRRGLIGAVLAAAIAALIALAPVGGDEPQLGITRAAAADPHTGVRAAVEVVPRPWGTRLTVGLRGATPGERCRLVARARDGRTEVAANWTATYRGSADVTGAAAITAADLQALDVVTATGRMLVHVPIGDSQ